MKTLTLLLVLGLAAGCSLPNDPPASQSATPSATVASATGVVQSVDVEAKTVTIAHDPVTALEWPAMTMTFQAPNVDLTTVEQGDDVSFEITSSGPDTSITSIERQ